MSEIPKDVMLDTTNEEILECLRDIIDIFRNGRITVDVRTSAQADFQVFLIFIITVIILTGFLGLIFGRLP